ncbi:MAG: primosomal protein N' [Bradymonadia bacterium]
MSEGATIEEGFAEVAVPVPLRRTFHYIVPPEMEDRVRPGVRVLVPFGRKRQLGYVISREVPPPDGIKLLPVSRVLDDTLPTFEKPMIAMLRWIADYYRAPIGEVMRAAHPAGTNVKAVKAIELTAEGRAALSDGASLVPDLKVLGWLKALAEGAVALTALDPTPTAAQVKRMVSAGLVTATDVIEAPRVAVRTERAVKAMAPLPALGSGSGGRIVKRDEIHRWLIGKGTVPVREVRQMFPRAVGHIKKLVTEARIAEIDVEVLRDPFFGEAVTRDTAPTLNEAQKAAVQAALDADGYAGLLLQGITGSGKTEVYLHAIEGMLARGRGALVLVPEIALTPQLVRRFRARLGDTIAVLHSGLSDGARFDQWRRLRRGEVKVAIGARSAVFAPVADLGIIVVDEEHDPSFKQSEGVRYHARDMAIMRAHREKAVVMMGSATPSMESISNVEQGKLRRLVLATRPTGGTLPEVTLVDMRDPANRPKEKGSRFLSNPLRDAMAENLRRGEQTILFLNRRGYSPFVMCRNCGHVYECDQCAISMVYHRNTGYLKCHYCDAGQAMPETCGVCGSEDIGLLGQGTERVEEALNALFPAARVARLDRDTGTGQRLQDTLKAMHDGAIDILVGTQMVTKGHDFPMVTLVGVLAADAGLKFPDFRSAERTFQLLSQVAGRAGRSTLPGRVLVQTYDPDHFCLRAVVAHDHASFAQEEMPLRNLMGYPPYTHAASIRIDGADPRSVERESRRIAEILLRAGVGRDATHLRGPAAAAIERIRGRTRWAMLLTADKRGALVRLLEAVDAAEPPKDKDLRMAIDVDPHALL